MAISPDVHCVEIFRVIGSLSARFAVCKCGWKGPQRRTLECVADDALQHEESDMELTIRKPQKAAPAEAEAARLRGAIERLARFYDHDSANVIARQVAERLRTLGTGTEGINGG